MKSFSPKFYAALTLLFVGISFLLYLFDIPFHYFPHLPFFFAVVCYEKRSFRRLLVVIVNALFFALFAHDLPILFIALLFLQLYLLNMLAFEVTTFDLSVVLFFITVISSIIVSADVAFYRFAFTGAFSALELLLSVMANLAAVVALFIFRRQAIDTLYTRDSWL
ncbi:MAG TPA: hypothetical protein PLV42_01780 [bacterium]|nr:hypothetical protein [bacterium]